MKLSNLTYGFLALMLAVISSNSQERGRGDRERGSRDAQWAREAMERLRGSDRANPLDPEAVKRRLDYAVKEGLMTREQADKMMVDAKKRMEVAQRGGGDNPRTNQRRGDDRGRVDMEAIRKRIEEGVRSGRIKRENAGRIMEGIRKRMEAAQRGNNEGRGRESQSNDRQADARKGYEIRRKRIEEGVKSGEIKREDAAKMLAELRKRMEAANRGGGDKKEESKEDPRLERYRAAERHFAGEVKAGKLSKEDAQKKLIEVRKRLWGGGEGGDKSKHSNDNSRKRTGDIVDVAAGNKSFRTLVAAVKAAGLVDRLKSKGPLTVFAPTDEAFAKLPKGTLQSLLKPENKKKLISILSYHVVPGRVLAKNVKNGRVKTLNGSSFEIRVDEVGVTVNKAKVVATDVMASNGVIHVVDAVIMPPSSSSSRGSQAKSSQSGGSSRGYLGVAVESSSKPKGLRIGQVYANTAAARAKLKKGDIILKMNGAGVTSNSGLIGQLSKTKPGQKATLLISSRGKTRTVQVQLGGSYSTRSSAQNNSSRSRDSQSSQSKKPQTKGRDHDHDKGERGKKDHEQDRVQHLRQAIGHLRAAGRHDLAKEIEKRMHEAHHNQDQHRQEHNDHKGHQNHDRRDRGEDMRKAWEERMKQWREARERAERDSRGRGNGNDRGEAMRKAIGEWMQRAQEMRERSERDSRGRDDRGEAMRKAWEERMKKAREDREREERNSRGRGNDRGEDMRKAWEERMKQWREARERDGDRDGRRPETHRGPQSGRGPQPGGSWRGGPERGRGPQGRGPGRGGPRGR